MVEPRIQTGRELVAILSLREGLTSQVMDPRELLAEGGYGP